MISLPIRAETANGSQGELPVVVVLGDSLVAGFGLAAGEAFPERLQHHLAELGHSAQFVNAGVSGDTTASGLARLDWAVPDTTDAVIIELGANDALRGIDPEATERNLSSMIERLQQKNIPVMLAGMRAPPNLGAEYEEKFNGIFPRLAEKYQVPLYPFFLEGVAARPELNQADGIHPTAKGIDVMVGNFAPYAVRFLESLNGRDT